MTTSLAVGGSRTPMRPHNKSTLWEEFLEHPVKEQKYFNTKHKKAYCKRCIHEKLRQIEESEEYHKEFQQSTNITADWEEWKELKAFESIEPISGRSSNMQRHINTCPQISNEDRTRIIDEFKATQAIKSQREAPSSVAPNSASGTPGAGGGENTPFSAHHHRSSTNPSSHPRLQPQTRNSIGQPTGSTPTSDDDSNSSLVASPPLSRRNTTEQARSSRPSPRLSVQSILNEESQPPPPPEYRNRGSYGPTLPPIRTDTDRIGVLDSASQKIAFASEEISHVRNSILLGPSSFSPLTLNHNNHHQSHPASSIPAPQHFRPQGSVSVPPPLPAHHQQHYWSQPPNTGYETILRQRDTEIQKLMNENADLKRKYNVLKQEFDGYKRRGKDAARGGGAAAPGGRRSESEGDDEEEEDVEGEEDDDVVMEGGSGTGSTGPRASSAPAGLAVGRNEKGKDGDSKGAKKKRKFEDVREGGEG